MFQWRKFTWFWLFILMGIVQRPTLAKTICYSCHYFSETLPLKRPEVIKFMHFSDNSKQNEFQGHLKLSEFIQLCST
jgi:hypothetical protein